MANKRLEIHPQALAELRAAVSWYLDRSESAAFKFVSEIDRGVSLVLEFPSRWPAGVRGTRRFIVKRFPFAIIYRELQDSIEIVAVAHGRMRPNYWLKRL